MTSQNFCYICQMILIVFVLRAANAGSSASVVEIHKEVGGAAMFTCPSDKKGDLELMYFQKQGTQTIFVNGFHAQKPVNVEAVYKNRSDVNSKNRHVTLWDLGPADEGLYDCVSKTKSDSQASIMSYKLTITANYSQPQLMQSHNGSTCIVTCSSYGGYPRTEMKMVVVPSVPEATVTERIMENPDTRLFNVSSTIILNFSQPLSVTCMAGNHSSVLQNVCWRIEPPQPDSIIIIVACVLVSVLFTVALAVVLQRRRCSRGRSLVATYSAAQRK